MNREYKKVANTTPKNVIISVSCIESVLDYDLATVVVTMKSGATHSLPAAEWAKIEPSLDKLPRR